MPFYLCYVDFAISLPFCVDGRVSCAAAKHDFRNQTPSLTTSSHSFQFSRFAGGLLITEATYISPEAVGYPGAPGIWTDEQVGGWRRVCDAVHDKGGFISCQLWHVGRIAHSSFRHQSFLKAEISRTNCPPSVSSSSVPIPGYTDGKGRLRKSMTLTYNGMEENVKPRSLGLDEIPRLIEDYKHAARCAMRAGFDAVELHGLFSIF